jgi:hypothetical protein
LGIILLNRVVILEQGSVVPAENRFLIVRRSVLQQVLPRATVVVDDVVVKIFLRKLHV